MMKEILTMRVKPPASNFGRQGKAADWSWKSVDVETPPPAAALHDKATSRLELRSVQTSSSADDERDTDEGENLPA
jgi:hypothetical protein